MLHPKAIMKSKEFIMNSTKGLINALKIYDWILIAGMASCLFVIGMSIYKILTKNK